MTEAPSIGQDLDRYEKEHSRYELKCSMMCYLRAVIIAEIRAAKRVCRDSVVGWTYIFTGFVAIET